MLTLTPLVKVIFPYPIYLMFNFRFNKLKINLKNINMFSKGNLVKAGVTLVVVLAALSIHQKFIAPKLAPKAAK